MSINRKAVFFLWLIIYIGLGSFFASFIAIYWFPTIPSDFSRTKRLLAFVENELPVKNTLVFGNSIGMNGFDGKLFTKLSCIENTYNLCSPGQNQLESLLLISSVSKSPEYIVHFINSFELEYRDFLTNNTINYFLLMNYKPSNFVKKTLTLTTNSNSLNISNKNKIEISFRNRWLLTNYFNSNFRNLLRNDLRLEKLNTELYYPRNYSSRLKNQQLQPLIKQHNPIKPLYNLKIDSIKIEIIKRTASYLKEKNTQYIVVFTPLNPDLYNFNKDYHASIDSFCVNTKIANAHFINFSNLLSKDQFVDHLHPSSDGAIKITSELAKILNKCSSRP
jgi:hypothetical protein